MTNFTFYATKEEYVFLTMTETVNRPFEDKIIINVINYVIGD